jgi:hypothetical protein
MRRRSYAYAYTVSRALQAGARARRHARRARPALRELPPALLQSAGHQSRLLQRAQAPESRASSFSRASSRRSAARSLPGSRSSATDASGEHSDESREARSANGAGHPRSRSHPEGMAGREAARQTAALGSPPARDQSDERGDHSCESAAGSGSNLWRRRRRVGPQRAAVIRAQPNLPGGSMQDAPDTNTDGAGAGPPAAAQLSSRRQDPVRQRRDRAGRRELRQSRDPDIKWDELQRAGEARIQGADGCGDPEQGRADAPAVAHRRRLRPGRRFPNSGDSGVSPVAEVGRRRFRPRLQVELWGSNANGPRRNSTSRS